MSLPPQLSTDIGKLQGQGFIVEVLHEPNKIGIIFKKYKLPNGIWNFEETDLLVITPPVYPNAKLDMFWVTPGLRLFNGNMPKAGDVHEQHFGTQWQRFSWHIKKWNPAVDNLLTYLDVVNDRLTKRE